MAGDAGVSASDCQVRALVLAKDNMSMALSVIYIIHISKQPCSCCMAACQTCRLQKYIGAMAICKFGMHPDVHKITCFPLWAKALPASRSLVAAPLCKNDTVALQAVQDSIQVYVLPSFHVDTVAQLDWYKDPFVSLINFKLARLFCRLACSRLVLACDTWRL